MEYHAWEIWIQSNAILMLTLFGVGFAALVKLSLMVWEQHKKLETSEFAKLVEKMEDLVDQIKFLFKGQEHQERKLDGAIVRISKLEKRIGEHFVRCNEREKLVIDIKNRQDKSIQKYDKALLRTGDTCQDRTDRDN